jgi:ElaB/YqjD/DUF883 family membrane-anchored ribosome-binding protein
MENEPEVTRHQMEDTRTSLSEKLETLEQRVVDTMQGATNAVADTVENVTDAVQTVKDVFDLPRQVKRHPWGMVGGAIALGYLGGYLLFRSDPARARSNGRIQPAPPDSPKITRQQNGAVKGHRSVEEASEKMLVQEVSPGPSKPGWLSGVNNLFGAEISQLKGLAIGTVLSVVRDMIAQAATEPMKSKLADMMDGITVKLGGEPTDGPVFKGGFRVRGEEPGEPAATRATVQRL